MQVALAAATSISQMIHPTLARRQPQLSTLRMTLEQATPGGQGMGLMLAHRCAIWAQQGLASSMKVSQDRWPTHAQVISFPTWPLPLFTCICISSHLAAAG